jgi:hypothetical protein
MEWVHVSKDVEAALEEIREGGDRAAAIVAATLVEEHLAAAITASLHQNTKITNQMFRSSGALGAFGSKIDLAFLIGMFTAAVHKELDTIKEIRNRFAHRMRLNSFNNQSVTDLVNNLIMHEGGFTTTNLDRDGVTPRTLVYTPDPNPPVNAREKYIRSCKYYTAILSMKIPNRVTMPRPFF